MKFYNKQGAYGKDINHIKQLLVWLSTSTPNCGGWYSPCKYRYDHGIEYMIDKKINRHGNEYFSIYYRLRSKNEPYVSLKKRKYFILLTKVYLLKLGFYKITTDNDYELLI